MKKILICLFSLVLVVSCVDDMEDANIDPKRTSQAPPVTLFTTAVLSLSDALTTPDVNFNNYRFYVQHWTSTQYVDEPRYNLTSRLIPQNMWQELYRDVLADLKEAKRLVNEDQFLGAGEKNNQLAQIEMMEVYTWFVIVTTWGDVPYTEALDPNNALPAYDDDQAIYSDLITRLNKAIGLIDPAASGFQEGDIFYNGNMAKWAKFGNSLKLKMGMVLADVDPGTARTLVEEAAPNVFTSNADNAVFPYLSAPPNNNPISDNVLGPFTAREDYVAASTLVDVMNALNDPRRPEFFSTINGAFVGGRYGFENDYSKTSTVSAKIADPTFESLLLDYSEVEFLLAEAVERGFNVGGTAQEHYNNAITASITYWGRTAEEAAAYLAQPGVNYTTAPGEWRQKIGTQKWIALYNRGFDAWLEWRRLDAPDLQPPLPSLTIPRRLIYPINEQTLNPENRDAAASAIGGDEVSTRLFWDVN